VRLDRDAVDRQAATARHDVERDRPGSSAVLARDAVAAFGCRFAASGRDGHASQRVGRMLQFAELLAIGGKGFFAVFGSMRAVLARKSRRE
jgi:hypothetical protein